jgi:hypothetical protein
MCLLIWNQISPKGFGDVQFTDGAKTLSVEPE